MHYNRANDKYANDFKEEQKRNKEERQQLEDHLQRSHKAMMDRLIEENMNQTRELNEEFMKSKEIMDDQYAELEARFNSLEERFMNRESRPEDIKRIRELESQMVKKNKEIKRVKEEMKYFKLELLNREENFNKTFSRTPNVGVMQVVKPNSSSNNNSKKMRNSKNSRGMPNAPSIGMDGALPPLGSQKQRPGRRPSKGGRSSKNHQQGPATHGGRR